MTDLSRTELGDLLRTRRARLRPEAVGLPPVAGGARLASGARKSQSSQASASTGTPDSSKAARSRRRRPPSTRWRGRSVSTRPNTRT